MENKTLPVTGGCLCGAVRYQSTEPPKEVSYCHCRQCQKSCGNPYFLSAFLPVKSFNFTKGEPKYYRSSAWADRGFCADCGTPLIFRDGTEAHAIYIATLDHPEEWPPTFCHSGMESRIPWDTIHDDLPCWNTEDDPEYNAAKALLEQRKD
ncbi:MAG: GFA family protein [Alphaproteobacteria bacterium]